MKNKLRKLISALGLTGLIFSAPSLHHAYLRTYIGSKVVKIKVGRSGGTGFHVKARSGATYMVTNEHICSLSKNGIINVYKNGEFIQESRIIKIDFRHDLCIVEPVFGASGLRLAWSISSALPVYLIGHPHLNDLSVQKGEHIANKMINIVKKTSYYKFKCASGLKKAPPMYLFFGIRYMCIRQYDTNQLNIISYPGNSGSPVVSPWGTVVGVLFAGSRNMLTDSFTVPLKYVRELLKGY